MSWLCPSLAVEKSPLRSDAPAKAQQSSESPGMIRTLNDRPTEHKSDTETTQIVHKEALDAKNCNGGAPSVEEQEFRTPLARAIARAGGPEAWKKLGASARRAAIAAVFEDEATPEETSKKQVEVQPAPLPEDDRSGHTQDLGPSAMSSSSAPRFTWETLLLDAADRTRMCEGLANLGYVAVSAPLQAQAALDHVRELTVPFFARPPEEKKQIGDFRVTKRKIVGYRQREDGSQFLEVHAAQGGKIYPDPGIPGFAKVAAILHQQLLMVGRQVLAWIAEYMGIPSQALLQCLDDPALSNVAVDDFGSCVLRLCNYAQCEETVVFGEHTDASYLTLAARSSTPGLQTWDRVASAWLDIEKDVDPCDIVVFIGDFVEVLTKGMFQATLHRVVLKPEDASHRLSMPFLMRGQPEAVIHTVPFLEQKPDASLLRVDQLEYDGLRKFLDLKGRARTRKRGNQCGNDRVLAPSSLGGISGEG